MRNFRVLSNHERAWLARQCTLGEKIERASVHVFQCVSNGVYVFLALTHRFDDCLGVTRHLSYICICPWHHSRDTTCDTIISCNIKIVSYYWSRHSRVGQQGGCWWWPGAYLELVHLHVSFHYDLCQSDAFQECPIAILNTMSAETQAMK